MGDKRRAAARDGIGKSIMAYRAQAIGAKLEFTESTRGGVSVRCALPCGCANGSHAGRSTGNGASARAD